MTMSSLLLSVWCMAAVAAAGHGRAQETSERVPWAAVLDQPDAWYGSASARAVADNVLAYQHRHGGWPKNIDMTIVRADTAALESTIDNGATTTQIRLLSRVFTHTGARRYRDAVVQGIEYLLSAQYPNGGWPQVYPLRNDYSRHITFNDNAMIRVMELLDDFAEGRVSLRTMEAASRERARAAVQKGIDVILKAQVRIGGSATAWCAQHDEVTLEPRKARTYEHPSLSGHETVGIVRFLMARAPPQPRVASAIEAAVAWLRTAALHGWRVERRTDLSKPNGWDRVMVRAPDAPPLWARFYDIGTNRPIFSGRDGVIRYTLEEIEHERRIGYAWVGTWPQALLEKNYPEWKARVR
jgi:PelA/Pel-15E family pectate lyase